MQLIWFKNFLRTNITGVPVGMWTCPHQVLAGIKKGSKLTFVLIHIGSPTFFLNLKNHPVCIPN